MYRVMSLTERKARNRSRYLALELESLDTCEVVKVNVFDDADKASVLRSINEDGQPLLYQPREYKGLEVVADINRGGRWPELITIGRV